MSSALATAIRRIAPSEYAARAADAPPFEPVAERTIGVFQLYHVLPQQRLQLHVFEPRYRGPVARARREPPTFAMAGPGAQVLCEVEITSLDQSRDGRYYIEVVGRGDARARLAGQHEFESCGRLGAQGRRHPPGAAGKRRWLRRRRH